MIDDILQGIGNHVWKGTEGFDNVIISGIHLFICGYLKTKKDSRDVSKTNNIFRDIFLLDKCPF